MISVILPAYNTSEYLELTLAAFANQTYGDYEVIVVDDGSTDATPEVVRSYETQLNLKYVHQSNQGRAGARNTGLRQVQGEIVLFNDDDRLPAPDFLFEHAQAHRTGDEVVIGKRGRLLSILKKGLPLRGGTFARVLKDHGVTVEEVERGEKTRLIRPQDLLEEFEPTIARVRLEDEDGNVSKILQAYAGDLKEFHFAWALGTTANMSVATQRVLEAGLFDKNYRGWGLEDTDLAYRLYRSGARFIINERAINYHQIHLLRGGGSGLFPKDELVNNLSYFCRKYETLECYLFWRGFDLDQGQWEKLDALSASAVLGKILELNDPRVTTMLVDTYREFLSQSLAYYRVVHRIKATRAMAVEA